MLSQQANLHTDTTPLHPADLSRALHSLPPCSYVYIADGFRLGLSLQAPADAGSPLADFSTLKIEAMLSSETLINPGSTQRHIPEDDILHSHRCETPKSYINNYCSLIILYRSK
jgi:hypothetical protein